MKGNIDIGRPPYANDGERQRALDTFQELERLDTAAASITALSKAFAAYRHALRHRVMQAVKAAGPESLEQNLTACFEDGFEPACEPLTEVQREALERAHGHFASIDDADHMLAIGELLEGKP